MPAHQKSAQLNTNRILRWVWSGSRISRKLLANNLGLDKSTVTIIVNRLIEAGIIEEHPDELHSGGSGRRPLVLSIRKDRVCSMGVELLPDMLRVVISDARGGVISARSHPAEEYRDVSRGIRGGFTPESLADEAARFLLKKYAYVFEAGACEPGPSAAESSAAEPSSAAGAETGACPPLLGVGVAMSGIVDQQRGLLKRSRLLGAEEDAALEERFARLFGVPVMLENDANAAIGGELFASRYRDLGDALFMLIESELFREAPVERPRLSLGLGLALDSRVHQGVDHTSGEFRSVYWQEGSDTQFSIPSSRLLDLSTNRDTRSRLFLEMGRNIALLINSLNIHTVIVGGDIQGFQEELAECLNRAVAENWSYSGTPAFQIREARQGEYASAYGAACLHANRLYAVDSFDEFTLRGLKTGLEAFEYTGARTTASMQ